MRTLGQERSEYALDKVLGAINIDKFDSFAAGAPTQILQNGFGQALAFWASKSEKDVKFNKILSIVKEWLESKNFVSRSDDFSGFIMNISRLSQQDYLAAQKEALALLEWVKRYAKAFCKSNDEGQQ